MSQLPSGVIPPMVTPLTEDWEVDEASLEKLVDHLVSAGVHGIFCLGSSGEVSFLTDKQRRQVVERAKSAIAGRVPLLAGVIDTSARRVLDQISRAAEAGAEYAVVTAPFYAQISQADVVEHFAYLARFSPIPLVAYDIPSAVHTKIAAPTMLEIARAGYIVAVKDSSAQPGNLRDLVLGNRASSKPVSIFTGTEVVVDADFQIGVDGSVPGLANVDPDSYVRLDALLREGKWNDARALQDRLVALFQIVACDPNLVGPAVAIGGFKEALKFRGVLTSATTAAPSRPLSDAARTAIHAIVEAHFTR